VSRFSIAYPYFIIVCCLMVCVVGISSVVRMPVDLFPKVKIPVVVVATFFSGMPAEQVENDITGRFERFFTLGSGIDHIESKSLPGVSLIKIYFQPGTDPDSAVTTISNLAMADLRKLPPGTLPPVVLKFDASSLPVCLITLKADGLSETKLRDLGQYAVRNQVASVPGASVPQPFGGKYRQIMVYVDPAKLEAYQLSAMDVVRSVNESSLILPSGDVKIGPYDYNIFTNSQIDNIEGINHIPLKSVNGSVVTVGDVGIAKDAAAIQSNIVQIDGQPSIYLPVLKQGGDSNTIAIVDGVKDAVAHLTDVPKSLITKVVFDQSIFVKNAIHNLIHEGIIGLILTGLMILIFLGSMKATAGVFLSIPLSVLATFIVLAMGGDSINSMILGGLALAFSRLIDNSVVALENIFRHLEMGETPEVAAEVGGREVALPVLAATLTTAIVFFPVTFLYGVSKYLFSALAIAVVLALFASYIVALTVVPLFCSRFLKGHEHHPIETPAIGKNHPNARLLGQRFQHWFNAKFEAMLALYDVWVAKALRRPSFTLVTLIGVSFASLALIPLLNIAYFPRTDPGQFVVNLKTPTGTRLELTTEQVKKVEAIIREVVAPEDLDVIASNIGVTPGFASMYTSNTGSHTAFVQVSLKEGHHTGSYDYMDKVRTRVQNDLPQLTTYFQSGGLVDAVLNMGLPAPINIQISGSDMEKNFAAATTLSKEISALPGVSDVFIPQDIDAPALQVNVNREYASDMGLSQKEVVSNVITALTSNQMIAPSYWVDPKSGNDYMLTVQYPESQVATLDDVKAIPVRAAQHALSSRLDAISTIKPMLVPTVVNHYQLKRVIDIYVSPQHEDLGVLAGKIDALIAKTQLPEGAKITVRGSVDAMHTSFHSFGMGLLLAVLLVYLVLVAQFKSFVDPLMILLAVPPGLAGAIAMLLFTGTSLNVMSLMGIVMMVGIVVSNSILIVEFAHRLREEGYSVKDAVATSCRVRLRPILMTSLATIIGLIPMALALGAGSEAYASLARVIIGGLSVSVVLTVFVVPAAFLLIYRRHQLLPAPSRTEAVV
jgi:multidrug efflux pump subunit AcrB